MFSYEALEQDKTSGLYKVSTGNLKDCSLKELKDATEEYVNYFNFEKERVESKINGERWLCEYAEIKDY